MKEFEFKDLNKEILKELEACEDTADIKACLASRGFDISEENAAKFIKHFNSMQELSDEEAAVTSGGGCSSEDDSACETE